MKLSKYLSEAKKIALRYKLFPEIVNENVLGISHNKKGKTIAYFVYEKEQFPGLILSIALDCYDPHLITDLIVDLLFKTPITKGEIFYRANSGTLHWGIDAADYYNLENNKQFLEEIGPPTDTIN